jgi:hypothetical protein
MPTLRGRREPDQREDAEPASCERRLLSPRTGLILLYALIGGATVGGLTYAVQHHPAAAVLAGLVAFVSAVKFVDHIIGTRWD